MRTESFEHQGEIRDISESEDQIRFGLFVENELFATAEVNEPVLTAMIQMLGKSRKEVAEDLIATLRDLFEKKLEKVQIRNLKETDRLEFLAEYSYRTFDKIEHGYVEYNVRTGETGPDSVPTVVRNKMRSNVHNQLASKLGPS